MRPRPAYLPVLAALLASCGTIDGEIDGARRDNGDPAETRIIDCDGMPGRLQRSESHLPDAPDIAVDGSGLLVDVTVLSPRGGGCVPVPGALVEIWHSGDTGRYATDRWRTARRTDSDGRTSYQTVRPRSYTSSGPHLHVRVTATDTGPFDWVVPVDEDGDGLVVLRLELRHDDAPTPTSVPDTFRGDRTGV